MCREQGGLPGSKELKDRRPLEAIPGEPGGQEKRQPEKPQVMSPACPQCNGGAQSQQEGPQAFRVIGYKSVGQHVAPVGRKAQKSVGAELSLEASRDPEALRGLPKTLPRNRDTVLARRRDRVGRLCGHLFGCGG